MARPFVFCPFCATPLQLRRCGHNHLPACSRCGFVQHFDPKVAVTARIEHDAHLLLVRRGTNPGRGLWALPGGYMDAGEMPEDALQREIREELDLVITVCELLSIYPMVHAGDLPSQGIVLVYRATLAGAAGAALPPLAALDDVAEAHWFAADALAAALPPLAFASTETEMRRWLVGLSSKTAPAKPGYP